MDLVLIALVTDSVGFWKLGYFHSVGYGLSMAAMSVWHMYKTGIVSLLPLGMATFGLRLAAYLYWRDLTYARAGVSLATKLSMWITSSLLFVCFFWPLSYVSANESASLLSAMGQVLFIGGLLVEAVADSQKYEWKRSNPSIYISTGLYRFCRHPNYFGELVMYWGALLSSPIPWNSWEAVVPSLFGLLAIHVIIAVFGMRRLEAKQEAAYGARSDYKSYARRTAKLVPFIW